MNNNYNDEKFWLEEPTTLYLNFFKFNPLSLEPISECLNSYTRLVIISVIILYIITNNIMYIYIGIFLILVIIIMYYSLKQDSFGNDYNINNIKKNATRLYKETQLPLRESDNCNISNNTQITDYGKKQEYSKASKSTSEMSTYINDKIFQTCDQHIFDNNTRQFYTMPNTSVPNDQDSFAQWLYGTESNCKEGSIYMHQQGTPQESCNCTGYNVSVPTNYGNLNDYE